jgi:hypothetical protein
VLGSFGNSLPNSAIASLNRRPFSESATPDAKKPRSPREQVRQEWAQLPFVMMRLTASRMSWDQKRLYWRDRDVQLGDIELTLARGRAEDRAPTHAATYRHGDLRREFAIHPSLEDNGVRWTAPGISDTANLSTEQLAEKLLGKLVTFYTHGLQ